MLVLSRIQNDAIRIGDNVRVVVTRVHNGRVWIGFDAPRDVPINREEVWNRIQRERRERAEDADDGEAA